MGSSDYWLVACTSKELKTKPLACEILSTLIVLFRVGNNINALVDRCPHRNVPLSEGRIINGNIECPYHGWQFNGQGKCQKIPGLCAEILETNHDATAIETTEKYGFIWVKLSEYPNVIYYAPFTENKNYHSFTWQTEALGSLVNILENFLDGAHTHFIHSGLIRSESKRQKVLALVKRGNSQVEIKYTGEGKQSGIISRWFEQSRKESYGRFILPSIAEIEYVSNSGPELIITAYITPISNDKHKIYAVISSKKGIIPGILKKWLITPFFRKILEQDLAILELQCKNIQRFEGENFSSTEIDLIRPHIKSLLKGIKDKELEKTISIML